MSHWKTNVLESLQLVLGGRSISITTALSVEELSEASLRPLAIEVDDGVVARLDQLDGGEALHLDLLQFIGSAEIDTVTLILKNTFKTVGTL